MSNKHEGSVFLYVALYVDSENQSWIFKSFSDAAADATADATNKIAIFN